MDDLRYATPTAARLFGSLFVVSFLAYGIGSSMVQSVVSRPEILESVAANPGLVVAGVLLMGVLHTVANIGLAAVLLPILKPHNPVLAYAYFGAALIATAILAVGAVFLFLLVPLSEDLPADGVGTADTLAGVLSMGGFVSYQLGMAIWGAGGLMLCVALYQAGLVPRAMSIFGMVGYLVFIGGTVAELFGYELGLYLSAMGGLFELALSLWLFVRGFRHTTLPDAIPAS